MIYEPKIYHDIADEMIRNDFARDSVFDKSDKLYHVDWELPKEWSALGWIRKFVSTKPADAIDLAIRTLSTREPELQITPLADDKDTREAFNRMEKGLKWSYRQLTRRGQSSPTRDILGSAMRYDTVVVNLVYLPYQQKALKALKQERAKRAMHNGKWAMVVHNPRNVHVQYSEYGAERVLLRKYQKYADIVSFWGDKAKDLAEYVKAKPEMSMSEYAYVYDYWDDEVRYVWVDADGGKIVDILPPQNHDLGFLPWVCRTGGTTLDDKPERRYRPLHATIMASDQWNTANLFKSLMLSLAMTRAAVPPHASTTMDGEGVEIDATEPIGQVKLKPGQSLTPLPPAGIDPVVAQMYGLVSTEMDESAGVELLKVVSNAGSMAFATFTAAMQSAMTTIEPSKYLAEQVLAEVFGLMIMWLKKTGDPLEFYEDSARAELGMTQVVTADEFPEMQDFYATVKLTPYIPSDQMQKINSMQILTNTMSFPTARALEQLDVHDPEAAFREWEQEQLDKAAVQQKIADLQFEAEMQRQQAAMMMQREMALQMQGGQPGGPPPGVPGSQQAVGGDMAGAAFDALGGPGFNPAMGGQSPVGGAPEFLREQLSGQAMVQAEGRDNRGLRVPPPAGRQPRE